MMTAAVFGMTSKFSSCTLSQMYRKFNKDGTVSGGPMYYLDIGLREYGPVMGVVGKALGILFAICVMFASFGGGNMFQANQTVAAVLNTFPAEGHMVKVIIGFMMMVTVGAVILGGIKRIGLATSRIVPVMVAIYVIASIIVILVNITKLPEAVLLIIKMAFTDNAYLGGFFGVLVMGIQRAAFSNEAGLGSAAIAHAAAKTDEPVREGLVGMIGPFVDTIVVCFMTAIVVVITGAWQDPDMGSASGNLGVALTMSAYETVLPWFPYVLTVSIALFAYSTMISWSYYGERGWIYLVDHIRPHLGYETLWIYRVVFVGLIMVGAIIPLSNVLDFL